MTGKLRRCIGDIKSTGYETEQTLLNFPHHGTFMLMPWPMTTNERVVTQISLACVPTCIHVNHAPHFSSLWEFNWAHKWSSLLFTPGPLLCLLPAQPLEGSTSPPPLWLVPLPKLGLLILPQLQTLRLPKHASSPTVLNPTKVVPQVMMALHWVLHLFPEYQTVFSSLYVSFMETASSACVE